MECIRFETTVRIGTNDIACMNAALPYKRATQLSAAEALALKNLFQCHFHSWHCKRIPAQKRENRFYVIICTEGNKKPHYEAGFLRSHPTGNYTD